MAEAMHKSKLAGFIIDCQTDDLARAADFWAGALGMPVRELPADEAALYKGLEDSQHGLNIEVQKVSHPSRVHLDALGLDFLHLGHHHLQHAVFGRCLDGIRLHMQGQRDRATEQPVAALQHMELLVWRVLGQSPLALDREQTVLERNLQVLNLDTRQLDRNNIGVLALRDINRRRPRTRGQFLIAVLFITGQTLQVFYQIPFTMVQMIEAIIVIAVASSEFLIRHRVRWIR